MAKSCTPTPITSNSCNSTPTLFLSTDVLSILSMHSVFLLKITHTMIPGSPHNTFCSIFFLCTIKLSPTRINTYRGTKNDHLRLEFRSSCFNVSLSQ